MHGKEDKYRLRIGKYPIIFEYKENESKDKKILYIIDIGSRGDIYK